MLHPKITIHIKEKEIHRDSRATTQRERKMTVMEVLGQSKSKKKTKKEAWNTNIMGCSKDKEEERLRGEQQHASLYLQQQVGCQWQWVLQDNFNGSIYRSNPLSHKYFCRVSVVPLTQGYLSINHLDSSPSFVEILLLNYIKTFKRKSKSCHLFSFGILSVLITLSEHIWH